MEIDEPSFYSPLKETEVSFKDNLPHMHQEGVIQYITFRLNDSLPQKARDEIKNRLTNFKENNPEPWDNNTTYRYWTLMGKLQSRLLDNGYGNCILKDPEVRKIVDDAIIHCNGLTYELIAYVVMPNHVHMLIKPIEQHSVMSIMQSLKSFTASRINRLTGNKGPVWMKRYYDRMVRNPRDLEHYVKYIACNPGHLPASQYSLYIADGM